MLFIRALIAGWTAFKAMYKHHTYIAIATLDNHHFYQYANHISVEAIAPVLDHNIRVAIEEGYMTNNATPEERELMEARARDYEEKRKRGEL